MVPYYLIVSCSDFFESNNVILDLILSDHDRVRNIVLFAVLELIECFRVGFVGKLSLQITILFI